MWTFEFHFASNGYTGYTWDGSRFCALRTFTIFTETKRHNPVLRPEFVADIAPGRLAVGVEKAAMTAPIGSQKRYKWCL